ncbi:MAG: glycosyltransferase family 4 protein [Acidobacteriota bacterium]|jgi:glycosyltransferase involved in cell wall biosynthesis
MLSFLFIDSERVWRGGQVQLFTLIQKLHQRGHKIHMVCFPRTSLEAKAQNLGISVYPIAIRSEAGLVSLLRLISVLRSVKPDILAFNTPKPIFIGNLASRFARVGARIIFRRVSFPLHNRHISRIKYTWNIDSVIAISGSIRSQLIKCGIPASLIRTIYEGIDLSLYPKQTELDRPPPTEPFTVGTVSSLSHEKGLNYLIEAVSLIPHMKGRVRFVIVGEGNCRMELEELVRKKELEDSIQLLGFRADIQTLMKDFDLFVLPSLSEGLSSAIMEAMASSLPVIASKVGGIPELVQNGDNGLLVHPADPESLAQAIVQLVENPETLRQMGIRGRERMEEKFTLDRKVLETEELCCTLVKSTTSGKSNV